MARRPGWYRGAYDYGYAYGDYDFGDRGAWSSPDYAYDEYDPRAGRTYWGSTREQEAQSAYADYYSEPKDCEPAPLTSQADINYLHAESQRLRGGDRDTYDDNQPYADQQHPRGNHRNTGPHYNSDNRRRGHRRHAKSHQFTVHDTHTSPSSSRAYSTAFQTVEPFIMRPTFTKPRSPTPPPPPPRVPDAEYLSISLQPSTSLTFSSPPSARKLLVLDLNGTLLIRPARAAQPRPRHGGAALDPGQRFRPVHPRPYMSTFRAFLFDQRTRAWLDTMVWSSAQPHSVDDMVGHCFDSKPVAGSGGEIAGDEPEKRGRDNLVAVWARDTLGLSDNDYHRKSQTTKDLAKPWAQIADPTGIEHPHSAFTTLLLDDSPGKAQLQPYNHVCICEYSSALRNADLEVLASERPPAKEGKKRKRKAKKKALAEAKKMRMPGMGETESGTSVSSNDDLTLSPAPGLTPAEDTPAPQTRPMCKYDETLLAVIGVLDTLKGQSNVAGWIRAGGLWGPVSPPEQVEGSATPSGNDIAQSEDIEAEPAMWFDNEDTFGYWAGRGRAVAEEMGIAIAPGVVN